MALVIVDHWQSISYYVRSYVLTGKMIRNDVLSFYFLNVNIVQQYAIIK